MRGGKSNYVLPSPSARTCHVQSGRAIAVRHPRSSNAQLCDTCMIGLVLVVTDALVVVGFGLGLNRISLGSERAFPRFSLTSRLASNMPGINGSLQSFSHHHVQNHDLARLNGPVAIPTCSAEVRPLAAHQLLSFWTQSAPDWTWAAPVCRRSRAWRPAFSFPNANCNANWGPLKCRGSA